jgi:hypothetical protein
MAEDEARPAGMAKGRMEAFSDGVFSIAATLLVLDLAVRPPGSPVHQFIRAWPSYLAYLISFLTIGGTWVAHHGLTDRLDRVDSLFLRLNLLLLLFVAFPPFPTELVAQALERNTGGSCSGSSAATCSASTCDDRVRTIRITGKLETSSAWSSLPTWSPSSSGLWSRSWQSPSTSL